MANTLVTVTQEDGSEYQVLMDIDVEESGEMVTRLLPRAQAEALTKAALVDYISLPKESEGNNA